MGKPTLKRARGEQGGPSKDSSFALSRHSRPFDVDMTPTQLVRPPLAASPGLCFFSASTLDGESNALNEPSVVDSPFHRVCVECAGSLVRSVAPLCSFVLLVFYRLMTPAGPVGLCSSQWQRAAHESSLRGGSHDAI